MQLNVYLNFKGNAEDAMNFYANALGGKIAMLQRFSDAPMPVDEDWKNKVLHGILNAADTTIYFSDTQKNMNLTFGDNISISLNFASDAEIDNAFAAFSAGGKITMPLQDQFWGAKFGMCTDQFGVNWMFNYDRPKN